MATQIDVDDQVSRLQHPRGLTPLVNQINTEFQRAGSPSLEVDLSFQYGESTWDSCAPIWVGYEDGKPMPNRLLTDGKLAIDVLTEELHMQGYKKISHQYNEDNLSLNVIRLSLAR